MTPMPFAAPLARALLRSQSDERLVKLAQEGHEGAFDEIVRRYRAPLVAFAAAYAPAGRAEDVVQEGLANAWVSLEGSDREVILKPWLYTIVRNRALNARRDARYHSELDDSIDGVARPDEVVLEREELSAAVAAIAALPEAQRKALVESAIEGRTHDQIAAELGTSPGSVRGLIHRGRVAVRGAVGALVPFPIAAWAASSGGAVAGGVAAGSAFGGSMAAKGAAVATIAVLATGSGIVVERSLNDSAKNDRQAGAAETSKSENGPRAEGSAGGNASGPGQGSASSGPSGNSGPSANSGAGSGSDDSRENDDNSGPGGDDSGHGGEDDSSGPGSGDDSGADNSGHGGGDDNSGSGSDDDNSGSGSSGSGSSGSGSGHDDSSGLSGSSGSGSSGSGTSGSGSGSSGSGSSGSGSGSSGSGSSGSSGSDSGDSGSDAEHEEEDD
jgi:RNA polymerase sigma factor (sigma-70 family)